MTGAEKDPNSDDDACPVSPELQGLSPAESANFADLIEADTIAGAYAAGKLVLPTEMKED